MPQIKLCDSLEKVRAEINRIDQSLLELLAERGAYVKQAAQFKKDTDAVRAPARVEQVIARIKTLAAEKNASPVVAEAV